MARPIWRGSLAFGLVTIPVELYSATDDRSVHFRQFQRGTSDRIRYRRVNERTGKEVPYDEIVKGYELEDGSHVEVEREELDTIAPGRSRSIDIDCFVDLDEIDPVYFQRSYWLAPAKQEYLRPYALLLRAMTRCGRAAIATFVMRGKEYVAAVRASGDVLALDTLLFADEVRDPHAEADIDTASAKPRDNEVTMAVNLIDSMSGDWDPQQYRDTYTDRVHALVEDKKAGRAVQPASEPAEATEVVDLYDALSRSVRDRGGGRRGRRAGRRGAQDRTGQDGTGQDGAGQDYARMTKGELERRARELGVPGRSKLSKDQLVEAVREAESGGAREAS